MEALPSNTFSPDTLTAGIQLAKEKAHVNALKEPLSDAAAALEKTVDSALLFVFGKHVPNPSGCPQPRQKIDWQIFLYIV